MRVGSIYNLQTEINTLNIIQLMNACNVIEQEREPRQIIILDSDVEIVRFAVDGKYSYLFQGKQRKQFDSLFDAVAYYAEVGAG